MADMTAAVRQPTETSGSLAPVFTACTAADKFAASTGRYLLYYRNGASAAGTVYVNDQKAITPTGAQPAAPAGATKWSDLRVAASVGATSDTVINIADVSRYVDVNGFVNLQHSGTLTTLTVAIFGPF